MGFAAPRGTPNEVLARLHTIIVQALAAPEVSSRLREMELEPRSSASPEDFAAYAERERNRWAAIIKTTGMQVD
jgi:tripartite-type tricarboxylate transporter receptor subunit TctC